MPDQAPGAPLATRSGAVPGDEELAVLDLTCLAEYCSDDAEEFRETLRMFAASINADMVALTAAVDDGNATNAELLAHRLKGGALYCGALRLARASEAIEDSAHRHDLPAVDREMARLKNAWDELREAVDAALDLGVFPLSGGAAE